ncbi:MAG TPA: ABC transporter permease [Rectinemataceae bacterium]|nr:ABC transporter permease [Rectinemataceae bacterium]
MRETRLLGRWTVPIILAAALATLCFWPGALPFLLHLAFPEEIELLYPRAALAFLVGEHLALTLVSSALAAIVGIGLAIAATRRRGGPLASLADRLAAMAQTFPPAAVLALSVPALGFGFKPTVAALFLYSVLPILRNGMEGLAGVPAEAMDAARGMGMGGRERLLKVELPLAAPAILAGLRTAIVVNIGTATIGATIGAGGLGSPIISGLVTQRPSYLAEGALAVALLALAADGLFAALIPAKPDLPRDPAPARG